MTKVIRGEHHDRLGFKKPEFETSSRGFQSIRDIVKIDSYLKLPLPDFLTE